MSPAQKRKLRKLARAHSVAEKATDEAGLAEGAALADVLRAMRALGRTMGEQGKALDAERKAAGEVFRFMLEVSR